MRPAAVGHPSGAPADARPREAGLRLATYAGDHQVLTKSTEIAATVFHAERSSALEST